MLLTLLTCQFFGLNLALAAVHTHRLQTVRKPHQLMRSSPGYVKRGIENEGTQDSSSELADLKRMLEANSDSQHEHSYMMIAASSGDSEGPLGGGIEEDGTISVEMLIMDFGETAETSNQGRPSTVPTIEAVRTVRRILPPPTFVPTLRSQQITEEARAQVNRLKLLAEVSASERTDPFIRLAESLGAAMAARNAEASKTTQAEPTEASEAKLTPLPTVVQQAPQSQSEFWFASTCRPKLTLLLSFRLDTFTLAEEKSFDNYNTSHHSQL